MNPTNILSAFDTLGQQYAGVIAPYALHLLGLLILVEVLTIAITWMQGSDDPPELLWRITRLLLTSGFAYWWIINCWALSKLILGSFDMIGQRLTNIPQLTPMAFVNTALGIAKMLWDAPSTARLIPDIGLRVGEFMLIIVILLIFLIIAALAIFTLASIFLIVGPGSILASFMPCRFTSALSEGYFTWIVRTGVLLLMFYVVLGAAETFALQWDTGIANACGATLTTLPAPMLGGPPIIVSATTCTNPIPVASLLTLFADVVILAFIAVGVPFTAAAIVSHGVNMAIEHLASARYLAGSVARPMARAMNGMSHQIYRMTRSNNPQSRLEQRLAAGAAAAATTRSSQAATMRLPKPPTVNAFGVQSTTALNGSTGRQTSKL